MAWKVSKLETELISSQRPWAAKLADEYGFAIVVDACHAPGGSFTDSKGEKQMIGNCKYADLTVFSFHPVKHIATGEGGAVTTRKAVSGNKRPKKAAR